MTPQDLAADLRALWPMQPAELLYWLADRIYHGRNANGARLCDASDFRQWLIEVAQALEAPERKDHDVIVQG